MEKIELRGLTFEKLEKYIKKDKLEAFRTAQVFKWVQKGIESVDEITDVKKEAKEKIKNWGNIETLIIECLMVSTDGTKKYLFRTKDDCFIESVLMKYKHGYSVCVSCQVGCKMNCKFCRSGKNGFIRNLTVSEMISQIFAIKKDNPNINRISNVVLMGVGEPLDNYENCVDFIKIISHPSGMKISQRNISLSTCGIIPKIKKLMKENLKITLSISLHAPTQTKRMKIMPISEKYKLKDLINVCKEYAEKTKRRVTYEYVMIKDFNVSFESAKELTKLLKNSLHHINLIELNVVSNSAKEQILKPIDNVSAMKFITLLENEGLKTTKRRAIGRDIDAACGQLYNYILTKQKKESLENNE